MRRYLLFLTFAFGIWGLPTEADAQAQLTAEQIMERVAANQDRAEELRRQYVYKQHIHVASRKTNGKLMREENVDYDVFPSEQGSTKKLKQLLGKYWHKNGYVEYSGEADPDTDLIDGEIVSDFRDDLANEKRSKDGLAANLFPLTTKEQKQYRFKRLADQKLNGRDVYHIGFEPKDKSDSAWAGAAFIDTEDFQPVTVFTKLSRKIPLLIRTALGTDVPGVGFSVTYKRQPDGVWFPASFGTEFRLKVLFFINRSISVSLLNSDFEHTHVESMIRYGAESQ